MNKNRRLFIKSSCLGIAAISAGCNSQAMSTKSKGKQLYDYTLPKDNLDAFVKVMGDLSGKPSWISAQGRIYALRPDEMPLPILSIEGLRWVRFDKKNDGYVMHTRDWAFYKDLHTGKALDEFNNPFTGQKNKTRHILTGLNSWFIGPNGQEVPGYEGQAWLIDKPFVLPWTQDGSKVSVPLELLVKYASGKGGGEWMNFTCEAEDFNDPQLSSVASQHAWTGDSGWIRWMNMGDISGRTLWQSTGVKHASANNLRPEFRELAEHYFPGSLNDPMTYKKTSYTVSPPEETSKVKQ